MKLAEPLGSRHRRPMHELVDSITPRSRLSPLRLPSIAGRGLPERLRSTAFAFLGLIAAAGLALVAIFAQPGFPLLAPVPLPDESSASESIADAERLPPRARSAPLVALGSGAVAPDPPVAPASEVRGDTGSAEDGSGAVETAPAPVASAPSGAGGGGKRGGGEDSVDQAPATAPDPAAVPADPAAAPAPAAASRPSEPPPEATTSSPPVAVQPSGPGNSSSAAAAAHASDRGIEASSGRGPPESPGAGAQAAAATPAAVEGEAAGGEGNGNANGHGR